MSSIEIHYSFSRLKDSRNLQNNLIIYSQPVFVITNSRSEFIKKDYFFLNTT